MRATSSPDPDASSTRILARIAAVGACAFLAALWLVLAPVPFLSEDWTHMADFARFDSLAAAFDPAREPLRPLQHAFMWTLAHCGLDPAGALPAIARVVPFALHAVAGCAVFGLARLAGLSRAGATAAFVLFALFPNVKMLAWPAAIGSPGRTAFELVALYFFARRVERGSARDGWCALAAFVVALGFHQTAFLVPAIVLAWFACVGARSARDGARRALAALRDPFVLASCAVAAAHLVHVLFFRPDRVHGVGGFSSWPARVVKAVLSLAPEGLREIGVEGFRGNRGTVGYVLAGFAMLGVAAAFVIALRRGGILRFAALAIALDYGLAVASVGFVQRYACLASAFLALALAEWMKPRRGAATLAIVFLGGFWAVDSVVDAVEIRRAGRKAIEFAAELRAAPADRPIVVVGVPDMIGAEEDVPYFNWGGAQFLRARGVAAPIHLVRTRPFRTNSDQELVDEARLAALRASGVDVRRWVGDGVPLAVDRAP